MFHQNLLGFALGALLLCVPAVASAADGFCGFSQQLSRSEGTWRGELVAPESDPVNLVSGRCTTLDVAGRFAFDGVAADLHAGVALALRNATTSWYGSRLQDLFVSLLAGGVARRWGDWLPSARVIVSSGRLSSGCFGLFALRGHAGVGATFDDSVVVPTIVAGVSAMGLTYELRVGVGGPSARRLTTHLFLLAVQVPVAQWGSRVREER